MKEIGRYEVVGRLGRGGMSTVYKCKAPVTERLVAVKILQPRDDIFADLVGVEKLRSMFVEEAKIMGAISHDHVAKIIDCDQHEDQPFIVLEYFAHSIGAFIGESYRVEAPSRIISFAKTKSYLLQTLKGLERLHFAAIIHRDIKPFNLMLTSDDRVKIIDFGLSRVRGEEKMSIPGMQVGSPYYAAPEQEKDPQSVDGRADIFSLGVLAYRMLTGRLVDIHSKKLIKPSSVNPVVDTAWDDCVMRALEKKPDNRYANAQQMRLEVAALPLPRRSRSHFISSPGDVQLVTRHRSEPCRVMYKDIRERLDLDALFRPKNYNRQRFIIKNSLAAHDQETSLLWQRYGAGFTMQWTQAFEYITHLNNHAWLKRTTWRLPTLEEVRTILCPPLHGKCSCWPLFDESIHWLWTSDYCTKKQAWMVDVIESYFDRLDKDGVASVCAVCSVE